ncbi:parathyroid hormone 2 receptor isoform X2 [Amyelois transitella]|uniref:parathyroid hormone 2 receptor isoform X2 n=1 Tax=Amyelois transitella TaxID=680683 RepID=UPI00298FF2CD|nr:parathyroid hormone 2 receptor isoform X2 [Amyelois transitella]
MYKAEFYNTDGFSPIKEALEVWRPRSPRVAIQTASELDCDRPEVYICEEPPDAIPPDNLATCNYRNVNYQQQVYQWVAGWGCLIYTPDFLYVGGSNPLNMSSSCIYGTSYAPCLEIAKEDGTCGCFPFDPNLVEVATAVQNALVPSVQGRWERCFNAAKDCCLQHMLETQLEDSSTNQTGCGTTFDAWTCWYKASAGSTASEVCAEFAYSNVGPSCHHFSSKQCNDNGIWELQTDYSTCSIAPRLLRRYKYHIAMLSFSCISCLPAVFIFFFYKRLRITRVALHRNLLIAIILRNILVIVSRSEIYMDELTNSGDTVMSVNSIWCRSISIGERVAANAVFICMLVEGIYLHRLIVAVFKKKLNVRWLYGFGAVLAIAPVAAWAIVMGLYDNHSCWLIYTTGYAQWILDTPRIAILLVNTVLFLHVMRVLLTKVRNSENANQLNTTKATLFLMPIFGVQFLLTAFRPNTTNCTGEQAYYYVAYTVEGLQGFIVAMLYCYVNKEVHMLLKVTYKKTESYVSRVRGDSIAPRVSTNPDRRLTYSTGLPSNENSKPDYAIIRPSLHVAEIISIQASERLADILEPVYETIESGVTNDAYESFEDSAPKRESRMPFPMDGPNWIHCVSSPNSSVYNNSINDYDVVHLDKKIPTYAKVQEYGRERKSGRESTMETLSEVSPISDIDENTAKSIDEQIPKTGHPVASKSNNEDIPSDIQLNNEEEDLVEEIMQYIVNNDNIDIELNPDLLSPNRKLDDKIVFVDK